MASLQNFQTVYTIILYLYFMLAKIIQYFFNFKPRRLWPLAFKGFGLHF